VEAITIVIITILIILVDRRLTFLTPLLVLVLEMEIAVVVIIIIVIAVVVVDLLLLRLQRAKSRIIPTTSGTEHEWSPRILGRMDTDEKGGKLSTVET
jgi:hypothetical protein